MFLTAGCVLLQQAGSRKGLDRRNGRWEDDGVRGLVIKGIALGLADGSWWFGKGGVFATRGF